MTDSEAITEIERLMARRDPGDDSKIESIILKKLYQGSRYVYAERHLRMLILLGGTQ